MARFRCSEEFVDGYGTEIDHIRRLPGVERLELERKECLITNHPFNIYLVSGPGVPDCEWVVPLFHRHEDGSLSAELLSEADYMTRFNLTSTSSIQL